MIRTITRYTIVDDETVEEVRRTLVNEPCVHEPALPAFSLLFNLHQSGHKHVGKALDRARVSIHFSAEELEKGVSWARRVLVAAL